MVLLCELQSVVIVAGMYEVVRRLEGTVNYTSRVFTYGELIIFGTFVCAHIYPRFHLWWLNVPLVAH